MSWRFNCISHLWSHIKHFRMVHLNISSLQRKGGSPFKRICQCQQSSTQLFKSTYPHCFPSHWSSQAGSHFQGRCRKTHPTSGHDCRRDFVFLSGAFSWILQADWSSVRTFIVTSRSTSVPCISILNPIIFLIIVVFIVMIMFTKLSCWTIAMSSLSSLLTSQGDFSLSLTCLWKNTKICSPRCREFQICPNQKRLQFTKTLKFVLIFPYLT